MADYVTLMKAAGNADRAGDEDAARKLVREAQRVERERVAGGGMPRADSPAWETTKRQPNTFGDTIEAATRAPRRATVAHAERAIAPDRTALERAGDVGMAALNAMGTGYSFGAGLVAELVAGDTTQEKKLARDLMMAGSVAAPELAGVSSTARIAGQSGKAAMKGIPESKDAVEAGKRSADDLGITPSLGAGGKVRAMTAAGLEKVPIAGGVIARDAVRFVDAIADAFDATKAKIGQASVSSEAGDTLQSGLRRYVERAEDASERLYGEVGKHIPAEMPVRLNATTKAVGDIKAPFADNPQLASKLKLSEWDAVLQEAADNGIGWQAVRQLRSEIGKALKNDGGALKDEAKSRLKRLYGALSEDMATAAQAAGPDAVAAWNKANDYYRRTAKRIEKSLDKTISAQSPERAFEAFANMAKADRATSDVTRMRQIKASMKPGEWRDVSASIVDRMGRPNPGQQGAQEAGFSAQKFLTDWNSMSDEAKRLLLPGDVRDELQKLADVAEMARNANAERNFSNTGGAIGLFATGAGAVNAPVATAATIGAAWGSAKAMTSPIFLRALNKASRGDIKQMKAMAGGKGPFAEDARTVLRILSAETAASANANQSPGVRAVQ